MSDAKWLCGDCDAVTDNPQEAPHPLRLNEQITGCPKCGDVDLTRACDEPGCERAASCGTPTEFVYLWACHEHRPKGDGR